MILTYILAIIMKNSFVNKSVISIIECGSHSYTLRYLCRFLFHLWLLLFLLWVECDFLLCILWNYFLRIYIFPWKKHSFLNVFSCFRLRIFSFLVTCSRIFLCESRWRSFKPLLLLLDYLLYLFSFLRRNDDSVDALSVACNDVLISKRCGMIFVVF